jgi:hypothetical protein
MEPSKVSEWLDAQSKSLEVMSGSPVMAAIVTESFLKSPLCMLQIGAGILMDKLIVLIVVDDMPLSRKLRGVADRIIRVKSNEIGKDLKEFMEAHKLDLDGK